MKLDDTDVSLVELASALAGADEGASLHAAAGRVAGALGASTVAILALGADPDTVHVLAASDDPDIERIPLALARYPEVRSALTSAEPVAVADVADSEILGEWGTIVAERGIGALLAFPMVVGRRPVGVLLVRFTAPQEALSPEALRFGRLAASSVAIALHAGGHLEALRELTRRQLSVVDYEQERRKRAIERYREFLESASEGMLVLDGAGRVLYLNRAAEALTGYSGGGLANRLLAQIVPEGERAPLAERVAAAVRGEHVPAFDLDINTTSGDRLMVSVACIGVLGEHQAAILAFRDVTESRALESELRRTKEFLERILNAAVDAIIATDMRGTVLLFNRGAERIFGYRAEDVVGRKPVTALYPPGGAEEVMRLLRSHEHGGAGRLESVRRDVINANAEAVPIALSAAIVYDDAGHEVATVGISSDLRERLRIEERLVRVQEKLSVSERQAVAVELAGAAAHELNQPLTSVMGYAEMLRKKLGGEHPYLRLVDTIQQEAERMAAIVRRIGSMVRYETKAYVGGAQIIDIERSSGERGGGDKP